MTIELRPITALDFPAFNRAASNAFGGHASDEHIERAQRSFDFDRSLAAFDGDQIVGTGYIYSFDLTLPVRRSVPAAGVSWITVLPTHRRRGILTDIMRRQFTDVRERGEPLAMLYASESIIYGRFGYGIATMHMQLEIDTRRADFARAPDSPGRVRLLSKEQAEGTLPDVYERFRLSQPGALTRSASYWESFFADPEDWRNGASARFYAVYEAPSGEVEGYIPYRIKGSWEQGFAENELWMVQVIALTPAARAGLWKYCLDVDLVTKVVAYNTSNDEPVRWMLADPRRLRCASYVDSLWIRLVDIPAALEGRCYSTDDALVFEVVDSFCPEIGGRYRLEGSPEGAVCARTSDTPDLTLDAADLGACYLGGTRFTSLARASRVIEETPGAAHRADLLFSSAVTPWCTTGF